MGVDCLDGSQGSAGGGHQCLTDGQLYFARHKQLLMGQQFVQIVVNRPADGVFLGDDGIVRAAIQHVTDRIRNSFFWLKVRTLRE